MLMENSTAAKCFAKCNYDTIHFTKSYCKIYLTQTFIQSRISTNIKRQLRQKLIMQTNTHASGHTYAAYQYTDQTGTANLEYNGSHAGTVFVFGKCLLYS